MPSLFLAPLQGCILRIDCSAVGCERWALVDGGCHGGGLWLFLVFGGGRAMPWISCTGCQGSRTNCWGRRRRGSCICCHQSARNRGIARGGDKAQFISSFKRPILRFFSLFNTPGDIKKAQLGWVFLVGFWGGFGNISFGVYST